MNRREEDARDSGQFQPVDDDGKAAWETEMFNYAADMKIITHYDPKPIPLRTCDWSAVTDNYEPFDPVGYGRTEAEAIADLKMELEA